jgi:16S rRNA (uracil1498-N3)-methyltransferase
MHRIMLDNPLPDEPGSGVIVTGDEAHHAARVKRLEPGDSLELMDGLGRVASARIGSIEKLGKAEGWAVHAEIASIRLDGPLAPSLRVRTGVPKGDRLEQMIDQLGQVGAASWGPLRSARSVVEPRDGKLGRLSRTVRESAKQSGRAWAMRIEPACSAEQAARSDGVVVAADLQGEPYAPSGAASVTLLVGPEGGWEADELASLRGAGVRVVSFGPHVMRIETAAVVAAGIVLDQERGQRAGRNDRCDPI